MPDKDNKDDNNKEEQNSAGQSPALPVEDTREHNPEHTREQTPEETTTETQQEATGETTDSDDWQQNISHEKPDYIVRYIAKAVDCLIAGALIEWFHYIGPVAAIIYLLVADGLSFGSVGGSIGKKITGLKVVAPTRGSVPCDFRESAVRNALFAILVVLYVVIGAVPYIGKLIVFIVAFIVILAEAIIIYQDTLGLRFGDRVARTMVVKR